MAIEGKQHRPSSVDHVMVSEASRRDAKPADSIQFETYREELNHWIGIKKRIESELSGFSKAAFSGEQAKIRRLYSDDSKASFRAWISRKASMEAKRQNLIKRKNEIEDEILRLKPLEKKENIRMAMLPQGKGQASLEALELLREDGTLCRDTVAAEMLLEIRKIRVLLEDRRDT